MTNRIERIRQILIQDFSPENLEINDESARHKGHAGASGIHTHLALKIRAQAFVGVSRLQRHRQIMQALEEEFASGLHALRIDADACPD